LIYLTSTADQRACSAVHARNLTYSSWTRRISFARPGNPYTSPDGGDWPDNVIRFAALGQIAAAIGQGAIPAFVPDVVHCHDWQAGLTHAYLHYSDRPRPGTAMTIHNLAYQGTISSRSVEPNRAASGIVQHRRNRILRSHRVSEGRHPVRGSHHHRFADLCGRNPGTRCGGMGLDGLLRARSDVLSGILNGIDTSVWNPMTDSQIASRYGVSTLEKRLANKAALQQRLGLQVSPNTFLLGVISRLSWQKGLDLLLENLPTILSGDAQLRCWEMETHPSNMDSARPQNLTPVRSAH
jgi:starch synthase